MSFALLASMPALAQATPEAKIACIPDKPLVHVGEQINVNVFVLAPPSAHLQYAWTATSGQISGTGDKVIWSLAGALSGMSSATVTVTNSGTKLGDCSVQITVIERERGQEYSPAVRDSARGFLITGANEDAGYGLYSYLLFGSPPTDSTRARYLDTLKAYLTLIQPLASMRAYRAANKLNITYVPIKVAAPGSPTADWLLANYDFARARVLLDLLPPRYQTGPYFVSALGPLSGVSTVPQNYLFQDLSLVPTEPQDLLSWWVQAFLNQAAQQQFWQARTGEMLQLKLRTMISVEAAGLPEVQKQLASWIAWVK